MAQWKFYFPSEEIKYNNLNGKSDTQIYRGTGKVQLIEILLKNCTELQGAGETDKSKRRRRGKHS
jgi:hypothetical protein